jgi:hypothetical protein
MIHQQYLYSLSAYPCQLFCGVATWWMEELCDDRKRPQPQTFGVTVIQEWEEIPPSPPRRCLQTDLQLAKNILLLSALTTRWRGGGGLSDTRERTSMRPQIGLDSSAPTSSRQPTDSDLPQPCQQPAAWRQPFLPLNAAKPTRTVCSYRQSDGSLSRDPFNLYSHRIPQYPPASIQTITLTAPRALGSMGIARHLLGGL